MSLKPQTIKLVEPANVFSYDDSDKDDPKWVPAGSTSNLTIKEDRDTTDNRSNHSLS